MQERATSSGTNQLVDKKSTKINTLRGCMSLQASNGSEANDFTAELKLF